MATTTVFRYRRFDINSGTYVMAPRRATRAFIEMARAEIIAGSEAEIDGALVDENGQERMLFCLDWTDAPPSPAMRETVRRWSAAATVTIPALVPPTVGSLEAYHQAERYPLPRMFYAAVPAVPDHLDLPHTHHSPGAARSLVEIVSTSSSNVAMTYWLPPLRG